MSNISLLYIINKVYYRLYSIYNNYYYKKWTKTYNIILDACKRKG